MKLPPEAVQVLEDYRKSLDSFKDSIKECRGDVCRLSAPIKSGNMRHG